MNTITASIIENRAYYTAKTVTTSYLTFAMYLSYSHITALFTRWGSHTPWAGFILIDSIILIGKVLRGHKMTKRVRFLGAWLQGFGAVCSLIANVLAADNKGDRVIGVMVIVFFLIIEAVAETIKPVNTAAARKAAATRKANAAAKAEQAAKKAEQARQRRERAAAKKAEQAETDRLAREVDQIEAKVADPAWFAAATAPVSPAPITNRTQGYL